MGRRFTNALVAAMALALVTLVIASGARADTAEDARTAARTRDFVRAAALWTELAQAGDRDAQYQLGSLYRAGDRGD